MSDKMIFRLQIDKISYGTFVNASTINLGFHQSNTVIGPASIRITINLSGTGSPFLGDRRVTIIALNLMLGYNLSVSSLLDDNADKSWANLYVNSMKVFNDLTVCGNLDLQGTGGISHNGDVTIDGKLTLTNTNNPNNRALEILGLKTLKTDGAIIADGAVTINNTAVMDDAIVNNDLTVSNQIYGVDKLLTGDIDAGNTLL